MKYFGIDIGGTKIKYAGFDKDMNLSVSGEIDSLANQGAKVLLENIFGLLDGFKFEVLGVSTAGIVGRDGEIVYANQNIPNYTGVKLQEILFQRYGAKTAVLNDIDAGAIGQYLKSGEDDFYFIALGTGIGGAFVKNGKIVKGDSSFAGQIGYLSASNGKPVDEVVSTRGLEIKSGVSAKKLFDLAKSGDKNSISLIKEWVKELSLLIKTVVGFFSPKKVVLGGGICAQGKYLLSFIKEELDKFPLPYKDSFKVEVAKIGNFSAVLGSISVAKEL